MVRLLVFLLYAGGGFFTIAFIGLLFDNDNDMSVGENIIALLLLGIAPLLTAYFVGRKNSKKRNLKKRHKQESSLLKLAQDKQGIISVADVAINLQISADDAKQLIDHLYYRGIFELQITDNGASLYRLVDFSDEKDRATANNL